MIVCNHHSRIVGNLYVWYGFCGLLIHTALWCVLKQNWKITNPSSYFHWFWQYLGILLQDWTSIFATTCHILSYLGQKFDNLLCKLDFFTWNQILMLVFWVLLQNYLQTKQSNETNDCLYLSPSLGVLKSRILMTWLCNLLARPPPD